MVLDTVSMTLETMIGSQLSATVSEGISEQVDEWRCRGQKPAHRSRQSVEPGDQHITIAGELQGGRKLRAIGTGAAGREHR
jgi:hypothetical protein